MFGVESVGKMFLAGFVIFIGILAILMPLFVMQIRDSNRRIVKWLEYISSQLDESTQTTNPMITERVSRETKTCAHCETKNNPGNKACYHCGQEFLVF